MRVLQYGVESIAEDAVFRAEFPMLNRWLPSRATLTVAVLPGSGQAPEVSRERIGAAP